MSFGIVATQKNYDLSEPAKSLKAASDSFYADPDVFPGSPAVEEKGEGSGSLKGLVYGPQVTIAYPAKYIQPYIRLAYQLGTLESEASYKSSTTYAGIPVGFETLVKDKRKTEFTQIDLGFRVPISSFYFALDAAMESMHYKIEETRIEQKITIDQDQYSADRTIRETSDDKAGGSVIKLGFGYAF